MLQRALVILNKNCSIATLRKINGSSPTSTSLSPTSIMSLMKRIASTLLKNSLNRLSTSKRTSIATTLSHGLRTLSPYSLKGKSTSIASELSKLSIRTPTRLSSPISLLRRSIPSRVFQRCRAKINDFKPFKLLIFTTEISHL